MVMRKRVDRGREGVVGGGLRDVAEFIVIKIIIVQIITWELPLQIVHFLLINKWLLPSNLLRGPACQMVQEDFQWVGGSL